MAEKEVVELDNSTVSSTDNSAAENLFADMKKVVEEAADDEGQSGKKASYTFGSCASVSTTPAWTSPTFPKIMEIDFGPTNCFGANGVNRRGKLVITLTDHFRDSGSVLTVQPQNYFINDIKEFPTALFQRLELSLDRFQLVGFQIHHKLS